jgi:hypothetical protein
MSSDDRTAAARERAGPKAARALLGVSTLLALAALLPGAAAEAQYAPPWAYPYYDGYPPPMPPGPVAAGEGLAQPSRTDESYGVLPVAEIRRRVALLGFHLIAVPRHNDRIYLAEAEDAHGLTHRLVFDAYEGNIIENTKLAVLPKKAKPASAAASLPAGLEKKQPEMKAEAKPAAASAASKPQNIDKNPQATTGQ